MKVELQKTKVKLPVTWEMCGEVEVDVKATKDMPKEQIYRMAIDKFYDNFDKIELPDGDYIDSSFSLSVDESDIEYLKLYNN